MATVTIAGLKEQIEKLNYQNGVLKRELADAEAAQSMAEQCEAIALKKVYALEEQLKAANEAKSSTQVKGMRVQLLEDITWQRDWHKAGDELIAIKFYEDGQVLCAASDGKLVAPAMKQIKLVLPKEKADEDETV